ncbi:MAG: hypothetical protein J4N98_05235, partial [Chloroflexi bacterium]|nr:hypothetical protein [Chloroflexota bacterium]
LLLGAALLAVGLACDGGEPEDTLTLEQYIEQLSSIDERAQADLDALWGVSGVEPEEQVAPDPTFAEEYASIRLAHYDEYAALSPPRRIRDAHKEFVATVKQQALIFDIDDPSYYELNVRTYDALCEIYSVADDAEIDHDFSDDFYCGPDAPYFRSVRPSTP